MMNRCYSDKSGSYKNYGARGVTVCEKWHSYDGFLEDVDSITGYDIDKLIKGELQLDKDVKDPSNLIYCKDKCSFISPQENYANRRNNLEFVAVNINTCEIVVTKNREKLCRDYGLDTSTAWRVLQFYKSGRTFASRKHLQHKGWVFQYTDTFSMEKLDEVMEIKKVSVKDSTTIKSKLKELGF